MCVIGMPYFEKEEGGVGDFWQESALTKTKV